MKGDSPEGERILRTTTNPEKRMENRRPMQKVKAPSQELKAKSLV
jgi:hypothetical protein